MKKQMEDWKFELNCKLARFYESGGLWLDEEPVKKEEERAASPTQKPEAKTMTEEEKFELNCQLARFYESGGLWDPAQEESAAELKDQSVA